MNQKNIIIILGVTVVILASTTTYFALVKNSQSVPTLINSQVEIIKNYKNEKYGFELQYPSFFTINEPRPDTILFYSNNTCLDNPESKLCMLGIDGIQIDVSDNSDGINIDQKYKELKKDNNTCKQISIFPLPENFNENELVRAIRCEFSEVPKQLKGGYDYTIFKDNKIFTVLFYQGNSIIEAYVNGEFYNIAEDTYDPLGDMIMRTFKFTK